MSNLRHFFVEKYKIFELKKIDLLITLLKIIQLHK